MNVPQGNLLSGLPTSLAFLVATFFRSPLCHNSHISWLVSTGLTVECCETCRLAILQLMNTYKADLWNPEMCVFAVMDSLGGTRMDLGKRVLCFPTGTIVVLLSC